LNYGFTFYDTRLAVKAGTALASARVWKADHSPAALGLTEDLYLTLPRGETDVKTAVDVQPRLIAPLAKDATVGSLRVLAGGQPLATLPLHPLEKVASGGWWRRLIDTIHLWFV
jgi:D-alanyl-D-alanine carboxypeptidase (penicillin-binding protein 5/6)